MRQIKVFYLARCHNCQDVGWPVPFSLRLERDLWVEEHRQACRHAIDTWKETFHDRADAP